MCLACIVRGLSTSQEYADLLPTSSQCKISPQAEVQNPILDLRQSGRFETVVRWASTYTYNTTCTKRLI
jgi:hypothetical protein